jgi:hypothetical protein
VMAVMHDFFWRDRQRCRRRGGSRVSGTGHWPRGTAEDLLSRSVELTGREVRLDVAPRERWPC